MRYRPPRSGSVPLLEWTLTERYREEMPLPYAVEVRPVEFLERFSRLIPPPRANIVRYAGALGPRSGLRAVVCEAARRGTPYEDLLAGRTGGLWRTIRHGETLAREARTAAQRAWAACIRRVFAHERQRISICRSVQHAAAC